MKKTLAILGSGHLGQQIAYYAISDSHYSNVVFFDDFTSDKERNGYAILGDTDNVEQAYLNNAFDEIIIALGYKHLNVKKALYERFKGVIPFGKVIHSSSWVDKTASINEGCVIYPTCAIDANAVINANTVLNIGCTIAHDSVIGKHCFLSPRVALAGFINVEEMCILGINSTIIDNIIIVEKTQVGGGTVVTKSITKSGLYVGNPHRFIR
ncbi:acetyltransferase [Postechiella marina]|uniref:Acetyltransferase n=1 Tax=Postechiella marina TaxID=943941 RepID=A0ABP8C593_9FLAO